MTIDEEIQQLEIIKRQTTNWEELAKIRVILFALNKERKEEYPLLRNYHSPKFWR